MTLLVAAKIPTRKLNPYRRPIKFVEKGILMVADTRLSRLRANTLVGTVDDARKIWGVADCALAGFAGDFRVAEQAIIAAHFNLMDRSHRPWKLVLDMMKNLLRYFLNHEAKKKSNPGSTVVLLGVRTGANSYRLFELDSVNNFKRRESSEIIVNGVGRSEFLKRFPHEIDHSTRQWAQQLSGYKLEQRDGKNVVVPSSLHEKFEADMCKCAVPIVAVLDNIVESGQIPSVGGGIHVMKFTRDGFTPIYFHVRSNKSGEWRMATLPDVRSYSEIDREVYHIPSVDDKGNVIP